MRSTHPVRAVVSAWGVLAIVAASLFVASPASAVAGPEIAFTSPAEGAVFATGSGVAIEGTVSDPGISYTWSFDGSSPYDLTLYAGAGGANDQISFTIFAVEGAHTFTVAGGGSTTSVSFVIDGVGPDVVITSPAEGAAFATSLTLDYTIGDGVASWIAWDGAPEQPAGSTPAVINVSGLVEGEHSVSVRAVDGFGNSTTTTRTFTVDRTGPGVTVTLPTDGSWIDPTQPFTIMATSDDPGTQDWDIQVDGSMVAGGPGTTPIGYGMPAPVTWADGSTHVITAQSTDAAGNPGLISSVSVRADATDPEVSLDAPSGVLSRDSVLTGTASDTGSGISSVTVDFLQLESDDSCGTSGFSATASITGGLWTLTLPGAATTGDYCIRASASDAVGHVASTTELPVVSIDVSGPVAPGHLTPSGEVWNLPSALAWDAVADAVSYRYRIAADEASLASAPVLTTTGTTADPGTALGAGWFWQVQGIDEFGNEGAWSDPQSVTVLGAPQFTESCETLCSIVGRDVPLSWSAVPGAIGYRIAVRWHGEPGDPSDNLAERYVVGPGTSTILTLPDDLPSGTIVVRVRAVLDHEVEGSERSPWSERMRLLHVTAPATPALIAPSDGAYVDGDGVELAWTDDPSVFAWDLRLSTSAALGEDGGLEAEVSAPILDPMLMLFYLIGLGGEVPNGLDLAEIDALADCTVFEDGPFGGEESPFPFPCGDGAYTLPDLLADGDYYWQVRGIGFEGLTGGEIEDFGPWSAIGHFVVGEAPAGGIDGTTPTSGDPTHGAPGAGDDQTVTQPDDATEQTSEPGDVADDADDTDGSGDAEAADGSGTDAAAAGSGSDGGFPLGWLLAGLGGLVVLTGAGVFIRFLVVRSR